LNVQNQDEWKFLWYCTNRKAFRNEIVAETIYFRMREFERCSFFVRPVMKWNTMNFGKKPVKWHLSLGLGRKLSFSWSWKISALCNAAADMNLIFLSGSKN
jgi:hypothetical protein